MMKKVAVVTGARRGIGLAIARKLWEEGYAVVLTAVSASMDAPIGKDCCYIRCDISQEEDRSQLFSQVIDLYGRIDVLVNNAGVAPLTRSDILETSQESFDHVMAINLKGTFFMCQQAANTMITLKKCNLPEYEPRIINVSSISSYTSSVNRGEYCLSKAGISMTTKLFADRLAAYDIGVFEVSPGIIMTDMTAGVKEKYEQMISEGLTPARRMGQPEDVADCVAALCSGLLDFAVGQVIHADGGFHLRRL